VTQINLGDKANPKPIFISESMSPSEIEGLIQLIREYIYVFVWNFKDMPRLEHQIAMRILNINLNTRPVKQQQRRFHFEIMEVIELEVKKFIDSDFVREEQHSD